jgi:hypothetical protein
MLTPILPIEESIAVAGEVVAFGDSGAWAQRTRRVDEDCSSTREMPSGILPQTGELAELIGVRLAGVARTAQCETARNCVSQPFMRCLVLERRTGSSADHLWSEGSMRTQQRGGPGSR